MDTLTLTPVGVIHSEHNEPGRTPIQPVCAHGSRGVVEVFPEYEEALDDIEGFSHLHLIYWLHRASEATNARSGVRPLKVVPFLDDVPRGVFATRSPVRPNPLGLSVVRLVERRGRRLILDDVDVLDGTPLLDIKPYVEGFDLRVGTRGGWTEQVSRDEFVRRGERRPGR
ncbi:MAG TPA: tRNA (N6-threonylcarbamoyladenosine(37)-N6)-methyltransferase TrmO [Thermoleophilia bacterium]|nr:tRNA (N6-threonylcarbamoyladenosine(37)-N6)-methyltransferase TrmO [Thermoleophilia bacterium]